MRILHAADFNGTGPGSFIPMLAALARYLRMRGDTFALVVPAVEGATWYNHLDGTGAELHVAKDTAAAIRTIREWRPDIVHLHFYGWEVPLTTALLTLRARIFWHAHSVYRWDRAVRPSLRTIAKYRILGLRVERIAAVSQAVATQLVQVGASKSRIVVIRNAVDSTRFRPPSNGERLLARTALNIGAEPTILFFGRNPRLKGADVLAAAISDLSNTVVITVATPPETSKALAASARVIAIDHVDDVVPLLWAADVLAIPSRGEGLPLVVLEAALSGLAIAASDLPAMREAAQGHARVRFAKVGDGAALASALRAALALPREQLEAPVEADSLTSWAGSIAALYSETHGACNDI